MYLKIRLNRRIYRGFILEIENLDGQRAQAHFKLILVTFNTC